ncbi:MAG: enoyl-CoA hydratase-related protein [Caulobacterales bacterium]
MSDEAAPDEVLYDYADHVATITLNAAERMNTLSATMTGRITELLVAADANRDVRAIILTGRGRAFCAGLDLRSARTRTGGESGGSSNPATRLDLRNNPPATLASIDTPVIAAVNGAAAGYGMDLALGCDFRIMARSAKISTMFLKRGLVPESGCTWLLPRLLGWEKAAELLMAGRTLDGAACVEWGLASRVVADDELMPTAQALAGEIAKNAPLAVQAAKRMMRMGLQEPLPQHMHHVLMQLRALMNTKDTAEGLAAFLEKREPTFTGE